MPLVGILAPPASRGKIIGTFPFHTLRAMVIRLLRKSKCVWFSLLGVSRPLTVQTASGPKSYPASVSVCKDSQLISIREIASVQALPDTVYGS